MCPRARRTSHHRRLLFLLLVVLLVVLVPERPRTLDLLVLVLGARDLPVAAALADVRNVLPAVFLVRLAQHLAEDAPGFLDGRIGDVRRLEHAFVIDGASDDAAVLVDG